MHGFDWSTVSKLPVFKSFDDSGCPTLVDISDERRKKRSPTEENPGSDKEVGDELPDHCHFPGMENVTDDIWKRAYLDCDGNKLPADEAWYYMGGENNGFRNKE